METLDEAIMMTKISYDASETPLSPVNDGVLALLFLTHTHV
jgi:hypothetical protein